MARNLKYKINRKVDLSKYGLELGQKTYIMGILNVTPDSFSDGGNFNNMEDAVSQAKKMIDEGADIIDIGAESTRPGHQVISIDDEINRLTPIVKTILKEVDKPVSIDTYKPEVAEAMLKLGVHIINDIWGLQKDLNMAKVVAKYDAPVVAMHNQDGTEYKKDIVESICDFFRKTIEIGLDAGIKPKNIILDPGIGFGKDTDQNIEVMSRLGEINDLGYPVLLGTSRKSMIGNILDVPSDERLEGTLATTVMGIVQGVDIIRVHDVRENSDVIKVTDRVVRRY